MDRLGMLPCAILLIAAGSLAGAAPAPPAERRKISSAEAGRMLDEIIRDLAKPDKDVRERLVRAAVDLSLYCKDGFTAADGVRAIRAAGTECRSGRPDAETISEYLLMVCAQKPRSEYFSVVTEVFENLGEGSKWQAQIILVCSESRDGALAQMRLIKRYAKSAGLKRLLVEPLRMQPRHADVYFPDLFEYLDVDGIGADVQLLTLSYLESELVKKASLAPCAKSLVRCFERLADTAEKLQKPSGTAWMWDEAYSGVRAELGIALDLLGWLDAAAEKPLRRGLELCDPKLKYFAAVSLWKLGKDFDDAHLHRIAASAETRGWLFSVMKKAGKLERFPRQFATQAALAESDMVGWLTYPTELGRVPDEIELMKVVPIDTGGPGGVYDYYVFRFRTSGEVSGKKGWLAGVSGPFRRSETPTTNALGDTFSTFESADSKNPEKHVGDTRELMEKWRNYHKLDRK